MLIWLGSKLDETQTVYFNEFVIQYYMRNLLLLIVITATLTSCKSSLVNYAFEAKGIYDKEVSLKEFSFKEKEIVFLPMHHIVRQEFYDDVRTKLDSLRDEGFVFFYESVKGKPTDSLDYYKFRKILHFSVTKDGYMDAMEELLPKMKFKYDLVNQPTAEDFGLIGEDSFNVDIDFMSIINNVEEIKEIILEDCDLENHYTEKYLCKDKFLSNKEKDKIVVEDRDAHLVQEIKKSKYSKIAVIYGKAHLKGVKKLLLE